MVTAKRDIDIARAGSMSGTRDGVVSISACRFILRSLFISPLHPPDLRLVRVFVQPSVQVIPPLE